MKSIKHPGNFLLACVMAVVCLICLSVCLFFRMDGELLAVGFTKLSTINPSRRGWAAKGMSGTFFWP